MMNVESQVCDRLHILKGYIVSRYGNQYENAEDIYGDTVLKIFRIIKQGKYREEGKVNAFMMTCVRSVMCDYYKKNNRIKRVHDNEYEDYSKMSMKDFEKQYEIQVEVDIFIKKMSKLKDNYKRTLILSLFQSMKHYEIAETLGISREAVSTHLLRARKNLGNAHLNKVRDRMEK